MEVYTSDTKAPLKSLELSFHHWAVVSGGTKEEEFVMGRFELHYTLVAVDRWSKDGIDLPLRLLDMQFNQSLKELRFSLTTMGTKDGDGIGREVIDQGGPRREGFNLSARNLIENSHVLTCLGEYNYLAPTIPFQTTQMTQGFHMGPSSLRKPLDISLD